MNVVLYMAWFMKSKVHEWLRMRYLDWFGNGSGVAGCSWWGLWRYCGMGWGEARGGTRHTQHKSISIIINNKFVITSAVSTLGVLSFSGDGQPVFAQPNFHTFNKSGPCSPKHVLFSYYLCHMIDGTFSHPYIWTFPDNVVHIWQTFRKCKKMFRHSVWIIDVQLCLLILFMYISFQQGNIFSVCLF